MKNMQRWTWADVGKVGPKAALYVTYADHVEALAQAKADALNRLEEMLRRCEEAAYIDLMALEDELRDVFGKGSDAERIAAGFRSAMPAFQQFHKGDQP